MSAQPSFVYNIFRFVYSTSERLGDIVYLADRIWTWSDLRAGALVGLATLIGGS